MKLDWLRADIASARRASALLVLLLVGSMLANVTLAAFAMHMVGRERGVVVPPSMSKTFWVESERVSAEYLEQMAYFLLQLTLNVTPQSIDHQSRVLLQYAAPASYGELRSVLATAAERVTARQTFLPSAPLIRHHMIALGRTEAEHHPLDLSNCKYQERAHRVVRPLLVSQ